jgi:hypothetical protein
MTKSLTALVLRVCVRVGMGGGALGRDEVVAQRGIGPSL